MNNNNKWILWVGLVVVLIFVVLVWQYAPVIQRWMANAFIKIVLLVLTFVAGWLVGRFGSGRKGDREKKNARNITQAQK